MMKTLSLLGFLTLCSFAWAQIDFTGQYEQNFDGLTAGAKGQLPGTSEFRKQAEIPNLPGWQVARIGGTEKHEIALAASAGGSSSGKLYSFGSKGEKDRALGALATKTLSLSLGVAFKNVTDKTFHQVTIKYLVEVWRTPSKSEDKFLFSYGMADGMITMEDYLTNEAMVRYEDLDAKGPPTTKSNEPANGNAAENRVEISATLAGLDWKPGDVLFLSWGVKNTKGYGAGIGFDDFLMTAE